MKFKQLLVAALLVQTTFLSHAGTSTAASALLAKSSLLGVQLSAQEGLRLGKINKSAADCIQSASEDELRPAFEQAISESFSSSEVADIEAFLESSLGSKFAKISLANVYNYAKVPPPEPLPSISAAEERQLNSLVQTSWGKKFLLQQGFEKPSVKDAIRSKTLSLLQKCGLGPKR